MLSEKDVGKPATHTSGARGIVRRVYASRTGNPPRLEMRVEVVSLGQKDRPVGWYDQEKGWTIDDPAADPASATPERDANAGGRPARTASPWTDCGGGRWIRHGGWPVLGPEGWAAEISVRDREPFVVRVRRLDGTFLSDLSVRWRSQAFEVADALLDGLGWHRDGSVSVASLKKRLEIMTSAFNNAVQERDQAVAMYNRDVAAQRRSATSPLSAPVESWIRRPLPGAIGVWDYAQIVRIDHEATGDTTWISRDGRLQALADAGLAEWSIASAPPADNR